VIVGACVTVTARAAESAAAGCDVRAVAAASTVAARLAVGKFGAVPAGGLGTVISACTFTDADEIRSRSWHGQLTVEEAFHAAFDADNAVRVG
jgi:hypothetical protein